MREWLEHFKRRREAGRSLRVSTKVRSEKTPYWYDIGSRLPYGRMHAGYVRAALLSAVGEAPACSIVEMPVLLWTRDEISRFHAELCEEFLHAGFNPLECEVVPRGDIHVLRLSVFSHEDVAWVEPVFRDAS